MDKIISNYWMIEGDLRPVTVASYRGLDTCSSCGGCNKLRFMVKPCRCNRFIHQDCLIEKIKGDEEESLEKVDEEMKEWRCPTCQSPVFYKNNFERVRVFCGKLPCLNLATVIALLFLSIFFTIIAGVIIYFQATDPKRLGVWKYFAIVFIIICVFFDIWQVYKFTNPRFFKKKQNFGSDSLS